jgi:hypothetical protein
MDILVKNKTWVTVSDLYDLTGHECTCTHYNQDTDEEVPSETCFGDCQDWRREDFLDAVSPYFRPGRRDTFWPTWRGLQPATFIFKQPADILSMLAPYHGNYTLKYRLVKEPGRGNKRVWIAVYLAHHDGAKMYFF